MRALRGLAPRWLVAPAEPIPLSERTAALELVRLALASVVAGAAFAMPVTVPRAVLLATALAYAAIAVSPRFLRRLGRDASLRVLQGTLLLDGVYLCFVMYATGGVASDLRILVCVHVVAVALVASPRTGLKIALWHTLLYLTLFEATRGILGPDAGGRAVDAEATAGVTLGASILGFWMVAIVAASCSATTERALRSRNVELDRLAVMVAEMARSGKASDIARMLLETLQQTFGTSRGAILASRDGEPVLLGSVGALGRAALDPGLDRIVERAMSAGEVALLRRLERETDPRLARLLPDGRNVLVVPLTLAGGRQIGVLILEHVRTDRIPAETVAMIRRFAFHAALALQSAWSLEEVVEKPWLRRPGLAPRVGTAEA